MAETDMGTSMGLSPEQTRQVIEAAVRAPSVHNSQPWRFRVEQDRIELLVDPERRVPVADPDDRELRIACGAALFNIRLALANHAVAPVVTIHPRSADEALAVVRSGGPAKPTVEEVSLFRAIGRRRTNRKPFLDQPVDAGEQHTLVKAAEAEHCRLRVVADPQEQASLHRMLLQAHRLQMADPHWVAEFTAWVGRSPPARDGVLVASSGPQPEPQDTWVLRDFSAGHAPVRQSGKDFESEPLIVVVATHFDDSFAQVQAGQALQRVLLSATTLGLAASFLSQVVEVADSRSQLRQLLGGSLHPQAVLRVGYGSPVPPVPRRPVEDCLLPRTGRTGR